MELTYQPDGVQVSRYMLSEARVALIQGPRASQKSTASCRKLDMNAFRQPVGEDGIARRKSYIVRPTYDQLKRTTVQTWLKLHPEEQWGRFYWDKPYRHDIRVGHLQWEVLFVAIEDERSLDKLLSAECSDAWVNEFREQPRKVIDDLDAVVGRWPDPLTCHMPQVICDTNAPRTDHWFAYMSGQSVPPESISDDERLMYTKPETWEYFLQPPAMFEVVGDEGEVIGYRENPDAENMKHLGEGYYQKQIGGKTRSWIRVNMLNKPALLSHGQPVWPNFREEVHAAKDIIPLVPEIPIHVGVDFGRTPAAVIGQKVNDHWKIIDELVAESVSAKTFAGLLKRRLESKYPGHQYILYGDPAGSKLAEADDITPFLMFRSAGLDIWPAPTNDIDTRIGTVEQVLNEAPNGQPRFRVSPNCIRLISAMAGDYQYKTVRGDGDNTRDIPSKGRASHIADALQYLMMGAGEGTALLKQNRGNVSQMNRKPKPRQRGWGNLRSFRRAS